MVRFSCFAPPIIHHRSKVCKRVIHQSDGAFETHAAHQDTVVNTSNGPAMPKIEDNNPSSISADQVTSPSSLCKSEDLNDSLSLDDTKNSFQTSGLRKCQSLGCIMENGRCFTFEDGQDNNEMMPRASSGDSSEKNVPKTINLVKDCATEELDTSDNFGEDLRLNTHLQETEIIEPFNLHSEKLHIESLFSVEVLGQFEEVQQDGAAEKVVDHVAVSGCQSSETPPTISRSLSLSNIKSCSENATEMPPVCEFKGHRSQSYDDFNFFNGEKEWFHRGNEALLPSQGFAMIRPESYSHDISKGLDSDGKSSADQPDFMEDCNRSGAYNEVAAGDGLSWRDQVKYGNKSIDEDDSHSQFAVRNGWRQPVTSNLEIREDNFQAATIQNKDEFTSKEFVFKRIEEWISQIDVQNSYPLAEDCGQSSKDVHQKDISSVADVTPVKVDGNNSLGIEAAYNYISSLASASPSAQMSNLGLVVIPFLGAFVSLRVLNLSGNSIVRITSGALPKGLHVLNLSKNNISTIEGLRDLTRLRILDMSCNRISRIGHGLASCSSLKELYLAGNKISEIEGLHRLLKLSILDLRFNKISTSKGLGQLAANYSTLQAINLEGNPAQRNVGDEQLKKYVLSLVPNLVYFNKQAIRSVYAKELLDKTSRPIASHQLDRGIRSEKRSRRVTQTASLHKSVASSSQGRPNHDARHSKNRSGHGPSAGTKVTEYVPNIASKLNILSSSSAMRRIRSEGRL